MQVLCKLCNMVQTVAGFCGCDAEDLAPAKFILTHVWKTTHLVTLAYVPAVMRVTEGGATEVESYLCPGGRRKKR